MTLPPFQARLSPRRPLGDERKGRGEAAKLPGGANATTTAAGAFYSTCRDLPRGISGGAAGLPGNPAAPYSTTGK